MLLTAGATPGSIFGFMEISSGICIALGRLRKAYSVMIEIAEPFARMKMLPIHVPHLVCRNTVGVGLSKKSSPN